MFALVREAGGGSGASLEEELDDWNLVLTPESAWGAAAADEPSAPPTTETTRTARAATGETTGAAAASTASTAPPLAEAIYVPVDPSITAVNIAVAAYAAAAAPSVAPHLLDGPAVDAATVAPTAPHMSHDASAAAAPAAVGRRACRFKGCPLASNVSRTNDA
jgi:hypothetical protein